jgi:hypothetical protein
MISRLSAIALLVFGAGCSSTSGGIEPRCEDEIGAVSAQVDQIQVTQAQDVAEKKAAQDELEAARSAAAAQDEANCDFHLDDARSHISHLSSHR